ESARLSAATAAGADRGHQQVCEDRPGHGSGPTGQERLLLGSGTERHPAGIMGTPDEPPTRFILPFTSFLLSPKPPKPPKPCHHSQRLPSTPTLDRYHLA